MIRIITTIFVLTILSKDTTANCGCGQEIIRTGGFGIGNGFGGEEIIRSGGGFGIGGSFGGKEIIRSNGFGDEEIIRRGGGIGIGGGIGGEEIIRSNGFGGEEIIRDGGAFGIGGSIGGGEIIRTNGFGGEEIIRNGGAFGIGGSIGGGEIIKTGGIGGGVEVIDKSRDFLGLNKLFPNCERPHIFYNRLKPIIVNAKARNVEIVEDSPPLIVKPAPVLIRRPGRVEIRPIIVKHQPDTLVVPKKITKITRPVIKKFYEEKCTKTEFPFGEEIIEEKIQQPFIRPTRPKCARTGEWLYDDVVRREGAAIAENELLNGFGPIQAARRFNEIAREEAIVDAELLGRTRPCAGLRNFDNFGFDRNTIAREEAVDAIIDRERFNGPFGRHFNGNRAFKTDIIGREEARHARPEDFIHRF